MHVSCTARQSQTAFYNKSYKSPAAQRRRARRSQSYGATGRQEYVLGSGAAAISEKNWLRIIFYTYATRHSGMRQKGCLYVYPRRFHGFARATKADRIRPRGIENFPNPRLPGRNRVLVAAGNGIRRGVLRVDRLSNEGFFRVDENYPAACTISRRRFSLAMSRAWPDGSGRAVQYGLCSPKMQRAVSRAISNSSSVGIT